MYVHSNIIIKYNINVYRPHRMSRNKLESAKINMISFSLRNNLFFSLYYTTILYITY